MTTRLTPASVIHWSSDQLSATVDDEVVILSVERGAYYGLDEIGTEIWQRLQTPTRIDALCDALAEKYDSGRAAIEHDVMDLLEKLADEGLVSVTA